MTICCCGHLQGAHFREAGACMFNTASETWACGCSEFVEKPAIRYNEHEAPIPHDLHDPSSVWLLAFMHGDDGGEESYEGTCFVQAPNFWLAIQEAQRRGCVPVRPNWRCAGNGPIPAEKVKATHLNLLLPAEAVGRAYIEEASS